MVIFIGGPRTAPNSDVNDNSEDENHTLAICSQGNSVPHGFCSPEWSATEWYTTGVEEADEAVRRRPKPRVPFIGTVGIWGLTELAGYDSSPSRRPPGPWNPHNGEAAPVESTPTHTCTRRSLRFWEARDWGQAYPGSKTWSVEFARICARGSPTVGGKLAKRCSERYALHQTPDKPPEYQTRHISQHDVLCSGMSPLPLSWLRLWRSTLFRPLALDNEEVGREIDRKNQGTNTPADQGDKKRYIVGKVNSRNTSNIRMTPSRLR